MEEHRVLQSGIQTADAIEKSSSEMPSVS